MIENPKNKKIIVIKQKKRLDYNDQKQERLYSVRHNDLADAHLYSDDSSESSESNSYELAEAYSHI